MIQETEIDRYRTGLCGSDNALIHGFWHYGDIDMAPATKGVAGHEGAGIV